LAGWPRRVRIVFGGVGASRCLTVVDASRVYRPILDGRPGCIDQRLWRRRLGVAIKEWLIAGRDQLLLDRRGRCRACLTVVDASRVYRPILDGRPGCIDQRLWRRRLGVAIKEWLIAGRGWITPWSARSGEVAALVESCANVVRLPAGDRLLLDRRVGAGALFDGGRCAPGIPPRIGLPAGVHRPTSVAAVPRCRGQGVVDRRPDRLLLDRRSGEVAALVESCANVVRLPAGDRLLLDRRARRRRIV
jgi:hypothetical protein